MRRAEPPGGRGKGRSHTPNAWHAIGERGRSNTPNTRHTIAEKGTNSSTINTFKALANEDFFIEIASVASNTQATLSSSKKVVKYQATTPSQKTFSEATQQESFIFTKDILDFNIYIEKEDIPTIDEVEKLRQKILDNTFYLTLINRPRQWIQSILYQKDMTIEHFYPNSNSNQPLTFSKCIIKSVLSVRDYGLSTNRAIPLIKAENETYSFNYWNYVVCVCVKCF